MIDVIPAIDLMDGACVRLSKGDYTSRTVYEGDPVEIARKCEAVGITRLHMVDLDGARDGAPRNLSVLEACANATSLEIDFGGGLKTADQVSAAQDAGASQVSIGSTAVNDPDLFAHWIERFGGDFFIVCADTRNGCIAVNGWQQDSELSLEDFVEQYRLLGVSNVLCTSIEHDGMLAGVDLTLYSGIMKKFPDMYLIASGGVASTDDIRALEERGIPAVVVGKALYEGRISIDELGSFYA